MGKLNGYGPDQIAAKVEDAADLIGQYFRHNDSGEIYKITEVGEQGVTAYLADGFGAPVSTSSAQYLVTWKSLKYKHRIMVHATDIEAKPDHLQ